ncbi:LysR family transcriptional regulator [Brevibacterium sp. 'Marine']|uniref:LysR family transcriptional regulator n=1 Tax=Brevibacterium sp. 'Marine' TaxID=2725563 RepID=UPI00145EADAE|nr:LysR family transcriptional regulator [Brevibacterium sp. 'Marine']
MLLSQLEYFVALAREEHFGRAAATCYVSPSTLSDAVRKLERELGVPLVRRGHNYEGLTPEGELALPWAQRLVADRDALAAELTAARGRLTGQATIASIPSGTAASAQLVSTLGANHPFVHTRLQTGMSSAEVVAKLRAFDIDGGIIHPSAADGDDIVSTPLPEVASVIIASPGLFPVDTRIVTGAMLADVPLCLLTPAMRARQILDSALFGRGVEPQPTVEADSIEALLALVATGRWAAVVPETTALRSVLDSVDSDSPILSLPLTSPSVTMPLAFVRLAAHPLPAVVAALESAATLQR